jgi:hypothetical protein
VSDGSLDGLPVSVALQAHNQAPRPITIRPLYVNAAGYDFRLQPSSTLINAGTLTGSDANGPALGNGLCHGSAPDIGACESP